MEHEIPFGNSNRESGPTFLDFPLFLGIFQWDEPMKRVPFTAEPEIPEILSKWKAPYISTASYPDASLRAKEDGLYLPLGFLLPKVPSASSLFRVSSSPLCEKRKNEANKEQANM